MKKMIKNWLVRGDCHGNFHWLSTQLQDYKPEETAIIILGDTGVNFYLNYLDARAKREIESKGYYLYLVRGNHEARPTSIANMQLIYDAEVDGNVYLEPFYPHIRYFMDFGKYLIKDYQCLVIGGAYSVDKWYRLQRMGITDPAYNDPQKTGWWANECLSKDEMEKYSKILEDFGSNNFDFVFTHTCPIRYQPTDLFLGFINQSSVDTSMEEWMDGIVDKITINYAWCFGHYHKDRLEKPHVEQYLDDIENIDTIAARWKKYDETKQLDWWLNKSPRFEE